MISSFSPSTRFFIVLVGLKYEDFNVMRHLLDVRCATLLLAAVNDTLILLTFLQAASKVARELLESSYCV